MLVFIGGYSLLGIIASVIMAAVCVIVIPKIAGYDEDLWLDLVDQGADELIDDQTWIENLFGMMIFMVAWPFKLVYMIGYWIPDLVKTYEILYGNED
jgi:hypothetical protein